MSGIGEKEKPHRVGGLRGAICAAEDLKGTSLWGQHTMIEPFLANFDVRCDQSTTGTVR